jgi:thioredoxin 1
LRALASIAVLALAACAERPESGVQPHARDSDLRDWFASPAAVLMLVIPLAMMIAWAVWRARSSPSKLTTWDDETFEEEVLGGQTPVLVHFSRAWSIPNRAALAQTELLAWKNRGAVLVGFLDVDASPKTMARFPALEAPAYLLFYKGRKLFHRPGLIQADDLQTEIDVALSREGF